MATADYALINGAGAAKLDRELAFDRSALLDRLGAKVERRSRPPAFKCLVVGVAVVVLYVWPAEFLIYLYTGGFSGLVFNTLLASGLVFGTAAAWIITARELRYWEENWHTVTDFSPPPPPLDLGGGHL